MHSQHTVAPLNTSLWFEVEYSGLDFLNPKDLAHVLKYFANEVGTLISL